MVLMVCFSVERHGKIYIFEYGR